MKPRPILAVDVDGVLNACNDGPPARGWQDTRVRPHGPDSRGFRIRYNPGHGERLLAIAADTEAELTWCTTWEEMANQYIRHLVGLPELPWVPMEPGRAGMKFSEYRSVGVTKAEAMRVYAGDRPFCWLDDEPDAASELRDCRTPHLVVQVDEFTGLQDKHFAMAHAWLTEMTRPLRRPPVIHLRLGPGDPECCDRERNREWVSECGWFVSAARSRSLPEWEQVTCKGCKRTTTYKKRAAVAEAPS